MIPNRKRQNRNEQQEERIVEGLVSNQNYTAIIEPRRHFSLHPQIGEKTGLPQRFPILKNDASCGK
jgi:hypothetical protein